MAVARAVRSPAALIERDERGEESRIGEKDGRVERGDWSGREGRRGEGMKVKERN